MDVQTRLESALAAIEDRRRALRRELSRMPAALTAALSRSLREGQTIELG